VSQITPPIRPVPEVFAFGEVAAGVRATAEVSFTNIGRDPIHFQAGQSEHPLVEVLTLPTSVFPGMRGELKVALPPGDPQEVAASFTLVVKPNCGEKSEVTVSVTASIKAQTES
jgi:hypothetical protein